MNETAAQETLDLWVDDERPAPEGWEWAQTVDAAIFVLSANRVRNLALDYVLGRGQTTDQIMYWLKDNPVRWPTGEITCHSSSGSACTLIDQLVDEFTPEEAER